MRDFTNPSQCKAARAFKQADASVAVSNPKRMQPITRGLLGVRGHHRGIRKSRLLQLGKQEIHHLRPGI